MTNSNTQSHRVIGHQCLVCKREIQKREYADYDGETWCSEFCDETSDAEKLRYLTFKPGDFGFWPCSICGCVIDDVYEGPGVGNCGPCAPKRKIAELKTLLGECLVHVGDDELAKRIQAILDNK